MKKLAIVVGLLIALVMVVITGDELRFRLRARRAVSIRPGDTKAQVKRILGEPASIFAPDPQARTNFLAALLSVSSETWGYGQTFCPRRLLRGQDPIELAIFSPNDDDVFIAFDASGNVSRVNIPGLPAITNQLGTASPKLRRIPPDLTLASSVKDFRLARRCWPTNYDEICAFVRQSPNALPLAQYEHVDFILNADGGLEIYSVAYGQTNRMILSPQPE